MAHDLVGHRAPIFAPIGALLILSNAPDRRTGRVLAATLGALIGIAIGIEVRETTVATASPSLS